MLLALRSAKRSLAAPVLTHGVRLRLCSGAPSTAPCSNRAASTAPAAVKANDILGNARAHGQAESAALAAPHERRALRTAVQTPAKVLPLSIPTMPPRGLSVSTLGSSTGRRMSTAASGTEQHQSQAGDSEQQQPSSVPHAPPPWTLTGRGYVFIAPTGLKAPPPTSEVTAAAPHSAPLQHTQPHAAAPQDSMYRGGTDATHGPMHGGDVRDAAVPGGDPHGPMHERHLGTFTGGPAALMLLDYATSPVGPYRELLLIPGTFTVSGKTYLRVSHIYVSSTASVVNARRNWGIPKRLAVFTWERDGRDPGREVVEVALPDRRDKPFLRALVARPLRLGLPVSTVVVPERLRTLLQPTVPETPPPSRTTPHAGDPAASPITSNATGRASAQSLHPEQAADEATAFLETTLDMRGSVHLAKLHGLETDTEHFPGVGQLGLAKWGVCVESGTLVFREPRTVVVPDSQV